MSADRDIFDENAVNAMPPDDNEPWFSDDDGFTDPESHASGQTDLEADSSQHQRAQKKGGTAKVLVAGILGVAVLAGGGLIYSHFSGRTSDVPNDFAIPNIGTGSGTGSSVSAQGSPNPASPSEEATDANQPVDDLQALYKQPTETSYAQRPEIPMPVGAGGSVPGASDDSQLLTTTSGSDSEEAVPPPQGTSSAPPAPTPAPSSSAMPARAPESMPQPAASGAPAVQASAPTTGSTAANAVPGNYAAIQAGQTETTALTQEDTAPASAAQDAATAPNPSKVETELLLGRITDIQDELKKAEMRNQELVSRLELLTTALDSRITALAEKVENVARNANSAPPERQPSLRQSVAEEPKKPTPRKTRKKESARVQDAPSPARESSSAVIPQSSAFVLRAATPQAAWIAPDRTTSNLTRVVVGQEIPSIGRVTAIKMVDGGRWVVIGTQGTVQ